MKKKRKNKWDLSLMYRSFNDPKIDKDIERLSGSVSRFAKKYKNKKDYLSDGSKLLQALKDYEKTVFELCSYDPVFYFKLARDIDSSNSRIEGRMNRSIERMTILWNKIIFFELNIAKIKKNKRTDFLKHAKLSQYHYFLKRIFEKSRYLLTEAEERILNLKELPSHDLWVLGGQKIMNQEFVRFQGKEIPLPESLNLIDDLPTAKRRKLSRQVFEKFKDRADVAELEINAVIINKKISDDLRGFNDPYDSTILNYENRKKTVLDLVETTTKNLNISHEFYKLKMKMLRVEWLEYADRSVSVGAIKKKFDINTTVDILKESFGKIDVKYADILDSYLKNGQIDFYPKKGKSGGAYCFGHIGRPTYVLLNYVPNFNSLMTFAHEMGHAIHTELSKEQTVFYQEYSAVMAEIASTLFENIVFDDIFERLTEKEKIIALHDRINSDISTIFRQIACFNFEKELHERIRSHGSLNKEEMAKLMNEEMEKYLGPDFKLKGDDGYFFVNWSHIRRFFYVYSYAFGQITSRALYESYKKDSANKSKIDKILSAGSTRSPEDILSSVGLRTNKRFFENGLISVKNDISTLENMMNEYGSY